MKSLVGKGSFGEGAAQQVGMHMKNGLTGQSAGVEDETVLSIAMLIGELLHHRDELREKRRISSGQFCDVRELLRLRYDEQMHRSFGSDVSERDYSLILKDDVSRNLARDDPREERRLGWS